MRATEPMDFIAAAADVERQLYKFALYQLGDERAAAEALQKAFVAAYANGAPCGDRRAFALTAFAAAWEVCRSYGGAYALYRPPVTDLLCAASRPRRAAFVLTAICRLSVRDAAQILSMPETAVRQALRAMAQSACVGLRAPSPAF